jgi:TolB protein
MSFMKLLFFALTVDLILPALHAQEPPPITIRPQGTPEIILAVADAQPASPEKGADLTETLKIFNQVLWDDLSFSGYFTLAGKSFYPLKPIVRPEDVDYEAWSVLPFRVDFLTAGTLDLTQGVLRAEFRIFDMKQQTMSFGQRIAGDPEQIRAVAHRWADEIVYKLSAGASKGIASTKIAFSSVKGSSRERTFKEIYVMDYDGYNQQAFTHTNSDNLFPNWAPDNSKLAFVSYRTGKPEINIYSFFDGSRIAFPMFNSLAMTPAISPDGTKVAFSRRSSGPDTDIYISNLDGSGLRNITNNPAVDTSPSWSPSGKQIAFTSSRYGGFSQIFICDADGANVRRIIKEGGAADVPTWSPDGRWIAFHWKGRLSNAHDIFIAEVSSGMIRQLTASQGNNESPSWSPDGRHITFESDRGGSTQIYIMLLGSTEARQVTHQGINSSPAWSGYMQREPEN